MGKLHSSQEGGVTKAKEKVCSHPSSILEHMLSQSMPVIQFYEGNKRTVHGDTLVVGV